MPPPVLTSTNRRDREGQVSGAPVHLALSTAMFLPLRVCVHVLVYDTQGGGGKATRAWMSLLPHRDAELPWKFYVSNW